MYKRESWEGEKRMGELVYCVKVDPISALTLQRKLKSQEQWEEKSEKEKDKS